MDKHSIGQLKMRGNFNDILAQKDSQNKNKRKKERKSVLLHK